MALFTALAGAGLAMAEDRLRERIIYTSLRPIDLALYLFASASGSPVRLSAVPALDYNPTFSPDGRWLVFTSQRGGLNDEEPLITIFNPQPYGEIHAVRLADGLVVRLTHNKWEDGTPTWAAISGE